MTAPTLLTHSKVTLALHELRGGSGRPLLVLHGLGERSPAEVPAMAAAWPGPVHALDLTGHGASTIPAGGGYTCEVLMGDADAAIAHLGPVTVLGRGVGGYVALLIAGGRPTEVRGAVIADGPGLFGGASGPSSPRHTTVPVDAVAPPDPFALQDLATDVRPPDYATSFVRQATHGSGLETPISVAAIGRPAWLEAVVGEVGVTTTGVADALAAYADVT